MSYEVLLFHPDHGFVSRQELTPHPVECVIVGAHERADLRIDHPAVWPRHLAIVITNSPVAAIRVLDLGTRVGFTDAAGRRLASATGYETLAVRVAGYVVVVRRESEEPLRLPEPVALPVIRRPSAHSVSDLDPIEPGGAARHLLVFSYAGRMSLLCIGTKTAAAGIIVGRSTLTDDSVRALRHPTVSRVHGLVVELRERLYWCDTATTHGTWHDSGRVKVHEFEACDRLLLPHGAAVSWEPLYNGSS